MYRERERDSAVLLSLLQLLIFCISSAITTGEGRSLMIGPGPELRGLAAHLHVVPFTFNLL